MADEQFKRNIAYKLRAGDVEKGKPVFDGERFSNLDLGGKRIVRVNLVGTIIDKFQSDGEKRYIFFTLDDASGQIKAKAFGDEIEKFKEINQGDTVVVIGTLRSFNNEIFISPEIMKKQDPRYLLVRKTELEKNPVISLQTSNQNSSEQNTENASGENQNIVSSSRDKIIEAIKASENEGGIEISQIAARLQEVSPESINSEVQKLLEEGMVFEPRPGKVRWLG